MNPIISLIGIFLGLVLLIVLAYKGHSIIWVAPVCAMLVAVLGGLNLLKAYMGDYMKGVADYVFSWFPTFFLGAVYGKIMDVTGSASGGLSIALEALAPQYLEKALAMGLSPEYLHRIASIASGGLDTLPHNGAVLTLLAVSNCTHKESYMDILVTSGITVTVSLLLSVVWGLFI